jgi:tRNA_anti-like
MQARLLINKVIMKRKTILRNSLLLVLILGSIAAYFAYREYNRKTENVDKLEAAFELTTDELIREFTENEQAATQKYAGKVLQVEGQLKTTDVDDKGNYTVVLGNPALPSSVRCSIDTLFPIEKNNLQINMPITVKGICTGFNADELGLGADVLLNRCIIIQKETITP